MPEPIADNIWLVNGDCVDFYGFPYPTRMVIVRLEDGGLWVWSPVKLTDELRQEVAALGPVTHLVGPNKIHHLFLGEWAKIWPEAKLWGPKSLIRKRKDLHFDGQLTNTAPPDWAGQIDQAWFRGSFLLDEVVFYHLASHTVIMADLSENFDSTFLQEHWKPWQRRIARIWKITAPWGYAPLEWRLSYWNRRALHKARDRVLGWQVRRVIMAHGAWQRENGAAWLRRAFAWM